MGSSLVTNSPVSDDNWHLFTGILRTDGTVELWRDGFLSYQGVPASTKDSKPSLLALGGQEPTIHFPMRKLRKYCFIFVNSGIQKDGIWKIIFDKMDVHWTEDFPLLVRLSSSMHPDFSLNSFAGPTQGGDLRIFSETGKVLSYEIDEWNGSNGESTLWVQIDQVSPDLQLVAYWGNENNTSYPLFRNDGSVWSNYAGGMALI